MAWPKAILCIVGGLRKNNLAVYHPLMHLHNAPPSPTPDGYYITKPCADATANPYQLFSLLVDAATDTSYTMDLAYYREGTKREADTTWDCAVPERFVLLRICWPCMYFATITANSQQQQQITTNHHQQHSLGTTIEPGTHLVQRRCSCQPYQLVQRDFA